MRKEAARLRERKNEKEGENKKQALESDIPRRKKTHIAYTQTTHTDTHELAVAVEEQAKKNTYERGCGDLALEHNKLKVL